MSELVLDRVRKSFGGVRVLDGVNLHVAAGELVGLVGGNGSGKTTIINLLFGVYRAEEGIIRVGGRSIGSSPSEAVRAGLARTIQNVSFPDAQSVRSAVRSVRVGAQFRVRARDAGFQGEDDELLDALNLSSWASHSAGRAPFGVQRRLDVARAFASGARILCLDEPAAGLAREEANDLAERLRTLAHQYGVGMIVIDHRVEFIRRVVDRLIFLEAGRVSADGPVEAVLAAAQVQSGWLGKRLDVRRVPRAPGPVRLSACAITACRGSRPVLRDLQMEIRANTWTSVLGPNGAGKTTLLETLTGLTPCSSGRVLSAGFPSDPGARPDIVMIGERRDVFPDLTVRENLRLGLDRRVPRGDGVSRIRDLAERWPRLGRALDLSAGRLSGGEQQLLAVARAWLCRASVLLIDEASAGLAPLWVEDIAATLNELVENGASVVTSDQIDHPSVRVRADAWALIDGRLRPLSPSSSYSEAG